MTDFSGDESFVYAFFYSYEDNHFYPGFENPFCFYNLDEDGDSEEVIRLSAAANEAHSLRWSMNIDNDDPGRFKHDYDFSISAFGPVVFGDDRCMSVTLRGIPTGPFPDWHDVHAIVRDGLWKSAHLTWDENDNNVDIVEGRRHDERWEGVISHGTPYMRGIGGPSCGPWNKRNEVDADNSGQFQFYYSPVDRRLHLYGAEIGWIRADYDYDEQEDMAVWMYDTDHNGFFDTWRYDVDADSTWDREVILDRDESYLVPFRYEDIHDRFIPILESAVAGNQRMIEALTAVLDQLENDFQTDEVNEYFRNGLLSYGDRQNPMGEKIRNSLEGVRYYGDLIRERYWHRFAQSKALENEWYNDIARAYGSGDYELAASLVERAHPERPRITLVW